MTQSSYVGILSEGVALMEISSMGHTNDSMARVHISMLRMSTHPIA
jgi:hypothetical protein